MKIKNERPETKVTHSGNMKDPFGSVSVPIYQTSTFSFESSNQGHARFSGKEDGYIYTRIGNPTINALENAVASLEGGVGALATASGMAANTTLFMAMLDSHSHLIGTEGMYGPTRIVVENEFSRFGVQSDYVDTTDIQTIREAIRPETQLIYIESPANPTTKLTDIKACADLAHQNNILLVVDNTFMSPILQNPLMLGADIVIHSLTKFINGHTDVIGGMLIFKDETLLSRIKKVQIAMGGTMDPHQAWLILRGMRTLSLRVERAQQNAIEIARFLNVHPKIKSVNYPGLNSHPQHSLAKKQMKGFGSIMSFEVKGGLNAGKIVLDNVKIATLAVSLGGYETLIQHPASMTHAGLSESKRLKSGITNGLIRLSVGCENINDLVDDMDNALSMITIEQMGDIDEDAY